MSVGTDRDDLQFCFRSVHLFHSLYLVTFASGVVFVTAVTLLPTYTDLPDPSGALVGPLVSALAIARAAAIRPVSWTGDRYDERTILLASLATSTAVDLVFVVIDTSPGFVAACLLQGLGIVGVGLLGLALVSELAPQASAPTSSGRTTAGGWAGIGGSLGAGVLYQWGGFGAVFGLPAIMLALASPGVGRFVDPDHGSVEGFASTDIARSRRSLTTTSLRARYAVAVTLVRDWVPIHVGVSIARGGLVATAVVVGTVVAAETFTTVLGRPRTGRLADRHGRAAFVALGGTTYGPVALAVPFAPAVSGALPPGRGLSLPFGVELAPAVLSSLDRTRFESGRQLP